MEYFKKLVGERVYLSPKGISEDEIEKFTTWMNEMEVTDYTGRTAYITTLPGEREWLENATKNVALKIQAKVVNKYS